MAGKARNISNKETISSKTIEKQLVEINRFCKESSKKFQQRMSLSSWLSLAVLGVSMILNGIVLTAKNTDVAMFAGNFIFYLGFAVFLVGILGIVKILKL